MLNTQVRTIDIVSIIEELHARGHRCDYTAIEAACHCEFPEIVAVLSELHALKVIVLHKGEYFVVPQEV